MVADNDDRGICVLRGGAQPIDKSLYLPHGGGIRILTRGGKAINAAGITVRRACSRIIGIALDMRVDRADEQVERFAAAAGKMLFPFAFCNTECRLVAHAPFVALAARNFVAVLPDIARFDDFIRAVVPEQLLQAAEICHGAGDIKVTVTVCKCHITQSICAVHEFIGIIIAPAGIFEL